MKRKMQKMQQNIITGLFNFSVSSLDEAESTSFQVEIDDLIVMGTDGLFDNLPTDQIVKEASLLEVGNILNVNIYWEEVSRLRIVIGTGCRSSTEWVYYTTIVTIHCRDAKGIHVP